MGTLWQIAKHSMSSIVALDTSVLTGLLNPRDHWHDHAKSLVSTIQQETTHLILFDCVVAECVSVICRRLGEKKRQIELHAFLQTFESHFPPERLTWIMPQLPEMYTAVLNLMRQSGEQLNFNDALIALACQQQGIEQIASFDRDFDLVPWLKRLA